VVAWRHNNSMRSTSSDGDGVISASNESDRVRLAAEARKRNATLRFHKCKFLGYDDRLRDGFWAVFGRETLVVDAHQDHQLRGLLSRLYRTGVGGDSNSASLVRTRLMAVVEAVTKAMGSIDGAAAAPDELEARLHRRIGPPDRTEPVEITVGQLFSSPGVGGCPAHPGCGLRRHRAILMKYLCDTLGICDVALVGHPGSDEVWNVAWVHGVPFLVDCIGGPCHLRKCWAAHALVMHKELADQAGIKSPLPRISAEDPHSVEILSHTAGGWVRASVAAYQGAGEGGPIVAEYNVPGIGHCRKVLLPTSRKLRRRRCSLMVDTSAKPPSLIVPTMEEVRSEDSGAEADAMEEAWSECDPEFAVELAICMGCLGACYWALRIFCAPRNEPMSWVDHADPIDYGIPSRKRGWRYSWEASGSSSDQSTNSFSTLSSGNSGFRGFDHDMVSDRLGSVPFSQRRSAFSGGGRHHDGGGTLHKARALEPDVTCVICLTQSPTMSYMPCGHTIVCTDCERRLDAAARARCPLCRAPSTSIVRTT